MRVASEDAIAEILQQEDVSYRQLDHWVRCGYLKPVEAYPGSGHVRSWPHDELDVVQRMIWLVNCGFKPASAAGLARAKSFSLVVNGVVALEWS